MTRCVFRRSYLPLVVVIALVASFAVVGPLSSAAKKGTAVGLARAIVKVAKTLEERPLGSSQIVAARSPKNSSGVYHVVFFPEHEVGREELVAARLPEPLAQRIFRELAYVDVGRGSMVVYAQEDVRLNFTAYLRGFAAVEKLLVVSGSGELQVTLHKTADGVLIQRSN